MRVIEAYGWYYWSNVIISCWNLLWSPSSDAAKKNGTLYTRYAEVSSIVLPWMIVKTVIDEAASATGGVEGQVMTEAADTIANITMVVMSNCFLRHSLLCIG